MRPTLGHFAFLAVLLLTCTWASAQQQAPTQHAPAQRTYTEATPAEEAKRKSDEAPSSKVMLSWFKMPAASRYIIKIARDPMMATVFFTVEVIQTAYVTPDLTPGAYYYTIEGFDKEHPVGKHPMKRFVVGKPLKINGQKEKLPAPSIIGPKHMDLFPTYGYVRLAWEEVEGARGYRFRLWNEDKVKENQRWKKDTPPRWITEVQHPWIEVHDAPYTSYMFLESGLYRWDVAAIDKDGGYIGDVSMGYFQTSRQWFFKPAEFFGRFQYGFAPHTSYHSDSSITGNKVDLGSDSHRFDADLDWWFWRQWGVNAGGGFRTFAVSTVNNPLNSRSSAFDTLTYYHVNLDLLFRTYLSTVPYGWWLIFNAGFGLEEFPQVDQLDSSPQSLHVVRPKSMGANLGFRVHKRWNSPWEMQIQFHTLVHAYTTTNPTSDSVTSGTFDGDLSVKAIYNWTNHFATSLGLTGESKRAMYIPEPFGTRSSIAFQSWYVTVGFQFNYYPSPDNTNYYPTGTDSAYYPSEKHPNYYRSEYQNTEDHPRDSSSWQRWRPR